LKFDVSLLAYSEILLKSDPVRRILERMLLNQIKTKLKMSKLNFSEISKEGGRIYITGEDPEKISKVVSNIFGVDFAAPALKTSTKMESIIEESLKLADEVLDENKSFAVEARRVGTHPYTSKDLEVKIGAEILKRFKERNLKVNLKNPDKKIFVEAREKNTYIYSEVFRGWGGLPVGSQGKLVVFLGNHFQTALAAWLMMKRGVFPVVFYLTKNWNGFEEEFTFAKTLKTYLPQKKLKVYVAPFKDVLEALEKVENNRLREILKQRSAIKIACKLGELKKAWGIVVGVTLKSKPIQILKLISSLEEASELPIFYPLIGFENFEVEELASKLNFPKSEFKEKFFDFSFFEDYGDVESEKLLTFEEKIGIDKLVEESIKKLKTFEV